jgi:hypothetical protein
MPTARVPITSLYQGTSNQHPARRRPGQVESAENIRFDVANGATRRNGTDFVAALGLSAATDWYFKAFKGRYLVAISDTTVRLFDMSDGTEKTITNEVGSFAYLSSSTGKTDIRSAALLDTFVILNRQVTTSFTNSPNFPVLGVVTTFDKLLADQADEGAFDPDVIPQGGYAEVLEDWKETRSGYYQKGFNDAGAITWTIVSPPQDDNAIVDKTSMPHRIVHDVDADTFTYQVCPWKDRLSGNDDTNPTPAWAGEKIEAIAAHQSRLFLIAKSTISSGEGTAPRRSVFNLFDYNVDVPTDIDRIEYSVTDSNVGPCYYAESVGADLVLVCQNGLVVYTSGRDSLTAFNARDFTIMQLPATLGIRPGVDAGSIFIADDNGRIHWFAYNDGLMFQGTINDHRPEILDGETIKDMFTIHNTLFVVTASGSVKVHERYVQPDGNQLSSWSTMTFFEDAEFFGNYLDKVKIVTNDATEGIDLIDYEHRQPFYKTDFDYEICLDRREELTGTYDGSMNQTKFTLTNREALTTDTVLVAQLDTDGNRSNQPMTPARVQGNSFWINGKWTNGNHFAGFKYTSTLTLSDLWAGTSDTMPIMSQLNVLHKESTDYKVNITEQGESANESPWTATQMGVTTFGEFTTDTGISQHLVLGDARYTTIEIESSSAGFFMIPAIEYKLRTRGRN